MPTKAAGRKNQTLADRLERVRRRAWHTGKTRRARKVQADAEAMDRRFKAMVPD